MELGIWLGIVKNQNFGRDLTLLSFSTPLVVIPSGKF
jgi:hypothetical protein